MSETVNTQRATEKASLNFARVDVLSLLWKRMKWLDSHIDKTQLKINEALRQRVYMAQVECSIGKAILYGLKDEELELRIMELEKKLEGAVLIPHEKPR